MNRRSSVEPLCYVVATYRTIEGALLSKRGHWTNIPYASVEDAETAAAADAGKAPFTVERLHVKR
jgi:hypothetical protein